MIEYNSEPYQGTNGKRLIEVRDNGKLIQRIFNMDGAANKLNELQKEIDCLKQKVEANDWLY